MYRNTQSRILGGVCSGVGDYLEVDYSIIRILWLLLFVCCGFGGILYLASWILIPKKIEI